MIDSHVGIDIGKFKFDVAVLKAKGLLRFATFPNTPDGFNELKEWLSNECSAEDPHCCMEATGRYGENLALFLYESGFSVSVVNPTCIKNYGRSKLRRSKTDKVDATLIAEYCLKEVPQLWQPASEVIRDLQQMTREMEQLKCLLASEKNRCKAGSHIDVVRDCMESRMSFFEAQIQTLEEQIDSLIEESKQLKKQKKLLMSIPGIGSATANGLLAEIPDISRFKTARQLVAFAGLAPQERSSGTIQCKSHMSKVGSSRLRKLLYMPAVSAKRYNPVIIALSSRIESSGKSKMVALGAAMRKLMHMIFGVLKSGKVFNKKLHSLET